MPLHPRGSPVDQPQHLPLYVPLLLPTGAARHRKHKHTAAADVCKRHTQAARTHTHTHKADVCVLRHSRRTKQGKHGCLAVPWGSRAGVGSIIEQNTNAFNRLPLFLPLPLSYSLVPPRSPPFFCFNLIKKRVAGRESYDAHLITLPSVSGAGSLPALYAAA